MVGSLLLGLGVGPVIVDAISDLTEQEARNSEAALAWYMVGSPSTIIVQF